MKRLAVLLLWLAAFHTGAQTYPSRPVRLVNPFPAGGPLDVLGRLMSERLSAPLGKPVVVENKPGAAGNIGAAEVARAAPDGHTVLLTLFSIVTSNPHLYANLPFDPLKDFAPVTALAAYDGVLIAHPSVPANSIRELVEYAKANPGKLNYASAGKASPGHLTAEQFRVNTGTEMTHVPYKGNAEAIRGVLGGDAQLMFTPSTGALPLIKAGKLKALAVYLADSVDELPNVPSAGAQGVKGLDQKSLPGWYGVLVPAGTPREVVMRLNTALNNATRNPKLREILESRGSIVVQGTPEDFLDFIKAETVKFAPVIKRAGVVVE